MNKADRLRLALDVKPAKGLVELTRPHLTKNIKEVLQISKDAESTINNAGGMDKMQPIEVIKLAASVQHVMNELGARN